MVVVGESAQVVVVTVRVIRTGFLSEKVMNGSWRRRRRRLLLLMETRTGRDWVIVDICPSVGGLL